jgi:protocatechuate 3,4-dioxygenase beta subunit
MSGALRWIAFVALLLTAPAIVVAQTPAQPASETLKATASIRGRITAVDTGRGLRRAQVSIGGGDLPQRRTASTNTRGEFEIRALPPGRYTVSVTRSGYLTFEYGQRRIGERGKTIDLAEGETMTDVDVPLPRASVISGRVIDENSEPVPGVSIWIMRQEFFRGRKRLVPVTVGVRTDDVGQYRATGLSSGDYVVFATLRETWTVTAGGKKQVLGYAPTYYPGTASIEQAQQVKVAAGKETANIEVALIAAPAVTISGTARRSDGGPLVGGSVNLSQVTIGPGSSSFASIASAAVDADGGWRLRDIPPGEYELEAHGGDRSARETAWTKVVVQGVDIDGLSLMAAGPVTISGDVVTESGVALPEFPGGRLRVSGETTGERRPDPIPAGDDNGVVKSDGTFRFSGVAAPTLIRVAPLPRGWTVKSVEIGGREMPDGLIDLKGGQDIEAVRIVLTDRFPSVTGRITDDRATAAEGTVVLFPADDTRWTSAGAIIRSGRTDQKGIFRLDSIPPGDYFVAALDAVRSWQINDPEFLAEIKPRAERLTVHEGASPQLNLRIAKGR